MRTAEAMKGHAAVEMRTAPVSKARTGCATFETSIMRHEKHTRSAHQQISLLNSSSSHRTPFNPKHFATFHRSSGCGSHKELGMLRCYGIRQDID
jgi:hypothetical protein